MLSDREDCQRPLISSAGSYGCPAAQVRSSFSQQSATCAPWGWGSLSLRAPATAGGSRVLAGNQLARWLAVAMVGLNVVNRMFLIPAYRFWSRHRMIASRIQSGEPNASETPGHPHRHRIPSPEGENPGSVFRFRRRAWVTMTTGHAAACRHARATGPTAGGPSLADRSACLAIPRTSSSAPADWSISARAGEPSTSSDDRQPDGKARLASSSTTASHALLAAWSSSGRGVPEKPEYGARSDRVLSWTKRRCTSARRSRPSRAAHRTAAAEASVPSTPTTIRPRVVGISGQTFALDGRSLTSSGRINGIPRRAAMSRPQAASGEKCDPSKKTA